MPTFFVTFYPILIANPLSHAFTRIKFYIVKNYQLINLSLHQTYTINTTVVKWISLEYKINYAARHLSPR